MKNAKKNDSIIDQNILKKEENYKRKKKQKTKQKIIEHKKLFFLFFFFYSSFPNICFFFFFFSFLVFRLSIKFHYFSCHSYQNILLLFCSYHGNMSHKTGSQSLIFRIKAQKRRQLLLGALDFDITSLHSRMFIQYA